MEKFTQGYQTRALSAFSADATAGSPESSSSGHAGKRRALQTAVSFLYAVLQQSRGAPSHTTLPRSRHSFRNSSWTSRAEREGQTQPTPLASHLTEQHSPSKPA